MFDKAMLVLVCIAMDVADTLSCRSTLSDVRQLVSHSSRPLYVGAQLDTVDDVDTDHVAGAATPGAPADDVSGGECQPGDVDDAERDVNAMQLDSAAADDSLQLSGVQPFPLFDDDGQLAEPDDFTPTDAQLDRVYGTESDAPPTAAAVVGRRLAGLEGPLVDDEGRSSPKTSVKLVDKNVSPAASKIAMLESVVYALHQQQMFQLEPVSYTHLTLPTILRV